MNDSWCQLKLLSSSLPHTEQHVDSQLWLISCNQAKNHFCSSGLVQIITHWPPHKPLYEALFIYTYSFFTCLMIWAQAQHMLKALILGNATSWNVRTRGRDRAKLNGKTREGLQHHLFIAKGKLSFKLGLFLKRPSADLPEPFSLEV